MGKRTIYTDEEKLRFIQSALQLKAQGVTWQRIADELGISRQTLRNWVEAFRKTAPIPLNSVEHTGDLNDWEREEIRNLERLNKSYLKALDKIEALIDRETIDKEEALAIKAVIDALTNIMRGLIEVNQILSTKRKIEKVSKGSRDLAKVREEMVKKYKSRDQKAG